MPTLLTIPIQSSDLKQIEKTLQKSLPSVGAFEIWIDQFKSSWLTPENVYEQVRLWKKITKKKLVIVCKDKREKGKFTGSAKEKVNLLLAAVHAGAHFVDAGLHTPKSELRRLVLEKNKSRLIISFHDFEKTPSTTSLESKCSRITELGADVIKIAAMCQSVSDTERLMELALSLKQQKIKHIILGMGEKGVLTRLFADKIGNELNFVSLDDRTAPGQLKLAELIKATSVLSMSK